MTLVRTSSGRSRERLAALLGAEPDYYFSIADGGGFAEVPDARLDEARAIPGITRARPKGETFRCWDLGGPR